MLIPIRKQANLPELPIPKLLHQEELIQWDRGSCPKLLSHSLQIPDLLLLGVGCVHHQRRCLDFDKDVSEFTTD